METTVIHIKDSTGADDEVYIGRAGKGHDGYFGNPIAIGKKCTMCDGKHDRAETLYCYEQWLIWKLAQFHEFKQRVKELKGKTLVCFCKPNACHGDVLKKYADRMY